jgi:PIN domain nuclease of toxin-antitoxin system
MPRRWIGAEPGRVLDIQIIAPFGQGKRSGLGRRRGWISATPIAVLARRLGEEAARHGFGAPGLPVLPFTEAEAMLAQPLLARHRGVLALGDATCLAAAARHRLPVLTADRAWAAPGLGLDVRPIRP